MADTKNYGLSGVSSEIELGKNGPKVKDNAGVIEQRNSADTDFVITRGADPVDEHDYVTKKFLETRAAVEVTAQIDGSIPTPAGALGTMAMVTTAGNGFLLKELYRSNGTTWDAIPVNDGMAITITTDLTGGTDVYTGDHRYIWDLTGGTWIDIGPSLAPTKTVKSERASLVFGSATPLNIGTQLPANAIVTKIIVDVTTTFNGSTESTLELGDAGNTSRLASTGEVNLAVAGTYVIDCYHLYGASTQVIGTYLQDSASQGAASIIMEYSII